jgi:PAS domain S-box-containing protein
MRWAGQLEALVNRSSAMVFVWRIARDFRAEYVSEGVRQLGYTPEDFTSGRVAWPSVTHPGDVPRLRREVGEHLHSGTDEFEQNYRVFTAAGKTRWVEDRNLVLRNSRGKPTHIAGLVLDVTARRRAERALAEGERKYRCLFEQSSDAIFVHDRTGGIVDANPRACAVFGVPRDRMLKMRLSGFRDRKQPPIFRKAMRHIMAKGSFTFDRTMRRPDGRLVDMEITSSLVDREKGLVLGVMRDATERRRAERALRESEENFRAIAEHAHDAIFIEDGHRATHRLLDGGTAPDREPPSPGAGGAPPGHAVLTRPHRREIGAGAVRDVHRAEGRAPHRGRGVRHADALEGTAGHARHPAGHHGAQAGRGRASTQPPDARTGAEHRQSGKHHVGLRHQPGEALG